MTSSLVLPFLDPSRRYCHGVELGMQVASNMFAGADVVKGYFRAENEEQIRLACYRLGYAVRELKPWRWEGKRTGWVWMLLVRDPLLTDGAGI
jgi:hypothetical protein